MTKAVLLGSMQYGTGANTNRSPVQQNKEHRNKSKHVCLTMESGYQEDMMGEDNLFNKWFWENYFHMPRDEIRALSHSLYKIGIKLIKNQKL